MDEQANQRRSIRVILGFLAAAAAVVALVAGLLIGEGNAASPKESADAKSAAYKLAYATSRKGAFDNSRAKWKKTGAKRSAATGAKRGAQRGKRAGEKERARLDAATAAAVTAARPTTGYYGGCEVPLFSDGYCPSPEEVQQELEAESNAGI